MSHCSVPCTSCFAALAAWHWRTAKRAAGAPAIAATTASTAQQADALIAAAGGRTLTEREAKQVLALYGVPVVGERSPRARTRRCAQPGRWAFRWC